VDWWFVFLIFYIFLIDIYDDSLKKSLTNFISFNSSEILKQTIKIFVLYTSITISIFIILNIFEIRSFNSLNLSMTVISSGGFLPTNNLSSILINQTQIVIFSLLMLVSFFSIFFIYNLILSLPFYFSIYNLTFINSFFESISGFTSTGFTIFDNIKHIDQGLILWRSSIQSV
jgi:trk system potassium uptake protein TrkH